MLKAKLVIVGGDAKAGEINLKLPTTIGRGKEADLTIPHALVSRAHSKLFERDGELWVEDLGSLNGTFVNNTRIESEQLLEPSQLLTLGNITFRAVYQVNGSARKTLPSTKLPDSFQTIKIDPIGDNQAASESTLRSEIASKSDDSPATSTSSEDTKAAPVFEETTHGRSAISEIDSFDPDEIGSLDSIIETSQPEHVAAVAESASKVKPSGKPNPTSSQPAMQNPSRPKKSSQLQPAKSENVALDLGISEAAAVSSVNINLDLPDNVESTPVSFIGTIQTGENDSPSMIEDFQIKIDTDDNPDVEVDEVRFDSFLKKLPK